MKPKAYIFDIDGTLADCSHRLHFLPCGCGGGGAKQSWDSFYAACVDDKPIKDNILLLSMINDKTDYKIIFVTGRPESYRLLTANWLMQYTGVEATRENLFMRPDNNYDPDYWVKQSIYYRNIFNKYDVIGVFEDRQQCVDMWRSVGLTCFQVAEGRF